MITPLSAIPAGEIRLKGQTGSRSAVPPLAVGEVVDAVVAGKQDGKMTITVKGMPLEASSNIPLEEGQVIRVRISQLSPKIVMTPVRGGDVADGASQLVNNIKNFRSDPALFKGMIATGKELLSQKNIDRYRDLMPRTDFAAIKERMDSLIFSKDTFQGYAERLGLLHEKSVASGQGASDNLKAMMMKLQDDVRQAMAGKGADGNALSGLEEFAAATVQKIETCQAVNLMSLEKDGLMFLPLSLLFGNEIRTGEFYAASKETPRGKEMRAVLCLETDNLGRIMAEASLSGGAIKCYFRCEEDQARDYLASRLAELKDGLEAVGYKAKDIQCFHEKSMDAAKMELLESLPAYSESVLSIKA